MQKTLVAIFDNQSEARQALDALFKGGFSSSQARLTAPEGTAGETAPRQDDSQRQDDSLGAKIAHFFGFGDDESTYAEAVRRGGCVVSVDANDESEAKRAADILERYGPVDIDQRQAQWREDGWQPAQARDGDTSIPVVEEQLEVGKREVQRGGVRVVSRAVERPVEETVNLREERATVERLPADRAAKDSDNAFREQSFEVRTTAEEAVVAKTSRVVEDVVIGKESSTRAQTVKDSVRKTEVDVQPLGRGLKPKRQAGQERRKSNGGYGGIERRSA